MLVSNEKNSDSPVTITAFLFLESEKLTIEQISERLGISPDSCRRKGDLNKAGKPFLHSSWKIKSERHLSEDADEVVVGLNDCLRDLFSRVENHQDRFRQLACEEEAGLLIGILADHVPPMIINGDMLERFSSLKLNHLAIDLIT